MKVEIIHGLRWTSPHWWRSLRWRVFAGIAGPLTLTTIALCLLVLSRQSSLAGFEGSAYEPLGKCGPYPRAQVKTPPWACVGLVAGPDSGLKRPRSILQISENLFVVTDMVGWGARQKGRLHLLEVANNGRSRVSTLFSGRNLPHGLAKGPDGWIYVGDEDRIWRFSMSDPEGTAETVLSGLPGKYSRSQRFENVPNHWHPLSHILFDLSGNLLINIGAPRDNCVLKRGDPLRYPFPCPWSEGPNPQAAVWSLAFDWPSGQPGQAGKFNPLAKGLRNSVAMAVHPKSGLVFQAENGTDIWEGGFAEDLPPEEINILRPGAHYGWPYCAGVDAIAPQYRARGFRNCRAYQAPEILMPAHAAPLGMAFYFGTMFPELRGKLLVALHGFRKWGHRIVAYDTKADGRPIAPRVRPEGRPGLPLAVVSGWQKTKGVRPKGAPVGILIANDGSIWFADDKAKTIMVLLRNTQSAVAPANTNETKGDTVGKPPPGWRAFYSGVLNKRCRNCHSAFQHKDPGKAWIELAALGFIEPAQLKKSIMFQMMLGLGAGRAMPPGQGLSGFPDDMRKLQAFLRSLTDIE